MALKLPAPKAAEVAIGAIGRGYDISTDIRLKYCKGDSDVSHLIEIDGGQCQDIVLPGGITVPNVSKSIKCDKGERMRFRSDVLSFQQVWNLLILIPISLQFLVDFFCRGIVVKVNCIEASYRNLDC